SIFDRTDAPDVKDEFDQIALPRDQRILKNWSILSSRIGDELKLYGDVLLAENIVQRGIELSLRDVPVARFGDFVVADSKEIEGFRSVENLMREYINGRKGGKPKPLSIGVFGPPGSGKSFGIKEIAGSIRNAKIEVAV